jgi:serine/threonine-protein kinase HipA
MPRAFDVFLSEVRVGQLRDEPDGRIGFRFVDDYRTMRRRPVLGQHFEDDLTRIYKGRAAGQLPRFFWNLLPEGAFRSVLLASFDPRPTDDLELLSHLGEDLPGAVRVVSSEDGSSAYNDDPAKVDLPEDELSARAERFGFSLAGAQLKFSMLRDRDRFVLPVHDERGDWILKGPASAAHPGVVENEWSMLTWARSSGFDVPECEIAEWPTLEAIHGYLLPNTRALAIRRFDRPGGGRSHQEDFAQVLDVPPSPSQQKYNTSAVRFAETAHNVLGIEGYEELIRRMVFVVASGNNDAHLKNWSLVYRDTITPSWSPLYDQLFTGAWPQYRPGKAALPFPGPRNFADLRLDAFLEIGRRVMGDANRTREIVLETIARLRATLPMVVEGDVMLEEHREALKTHWLHVPMLAAIT